MRISKGNTIVEIEDFRFEMLWDEKLSYNKNSASYDAGVAETKVYKNGKYIQTLGKTENVGGLNYVTLWFYDYNMDGHIDISYSISCGKSCWPMYYFYNFDKQNFEHIKEWDYMKLWELNKDEKQFLTVPDGSASQGDQKWYQIEGVKLKLLDTIYYGE